MNRHSAQISHALSGDAGAGKAPHLLELRPAGLARAHVDLQYLYRLHGQRPFSCCLVASPTTPKGRLTVRARRAVIGFTPTADSEWWIAQLQLLGTTSLNGTCRIESFQRGDGAIGYLPRVVVEVRLDYGSQAQVGPAPVAPGFVAGRSATVLEPEHLREEKPRRTAA